MPTETKKETLKDQFYARMLAHYEKGTLTLVGFQDIMQQFLLFERNKKYLQHSYPGMWVAYQDGKEYVAESEIEISNMLKKVNPGRTRKSFIANVPELHSNATW